METKIDFSQIAFPAFVTVYGPGKDWISSHNRHEYPDHFACGVCDDAAGIERLMKGYQGWPDRLQVYIVPNPKAVLEKYENRFSATYEESIDECAK